MGSYTINGSDYIKTLISIDSSSTKTGWAVFIDGEYEISGVINLNTKEFRNNSEKRVKQMCFELRDILEKYMPNIVVIEKLNVSRNMNTVRQLSKIIGFVYSYSVINNCKYYEIQPSQWRSKLGMQKNGRKREEYKKISIEYVKNNIGIDVTDDESDAICAGLGYIKMSH